MTSVTRARLDVRPFAGRRPATWITIHGPRHARAWSARLVVGCLLVSAVALAFGTKTRSRGGVLAASVATLVAPLLALASRAALARRVVIDARGWSLAPIVGTPRRMPRVRDAYASGEDVVVHDDARRTTVLGVAGRTSRTTLIAALRDLADAAPRAPSLPKEDS